MKNRSLLLILCLAVTLTSVMSFSACKKKTSDEAVPKDIDIQETIVDPNAKKAIIILPGITGSELCAGEDYTTLINTKINKGDTVWVPKELYKTINSFTNSDFDFSEFSTEGLVNFTYSLVMLSNNDDGTSKYNVEAKNVEKGDDIIGTLATYNTLYDQLSAKFSKTHDVIFFSYDWRMPTQTAASELEEFINENDYTHVTFVCHSMGGIVAAQYLSANDENFAKTERLVTLGTPYGGSARALMTLQKGRYFDISIADEPIRELSRNMTSIYELLPTSDQIINHGGYIFNNGMRLDSEATVSFIENSAKTNEYDSESALNSLLFNNALEAHSALYKNEGHIINDPALDAYMIAGYNSETVNEIYEENGIITHTKATNYGDGTVTCESACYFNGKLFDNPIYFLNGVSHQDLVKDANSIQLVIALIAKGSAISEEDYNTNVISDYNNITLTDDSGIEKKSIDSFSIEIPLSIPNPFDQQ